MNALRHIFTALLLPLVCCFAMTSCATQSAINAAQGNPTGALPNQPGYRNAPPNPAYYALVPLAIPFDLLTLPIQFVSMNAQGGQFPTTSVSQPPPYTPPQQ